jgi:hypothetical protein
MRRSQLSRDSLRRSGDSSGSGGNCDCEANWPLGKVRYYAIDPVAGDDTNFGYVEEDPGFVWPDSTALDAVALKTYEEFYTRIPKQGALRRAVLLIKGNASSQVTVYKKDGTTIDDLQVYGIAGYRYLAIRASNFTNSPEDRVNLAGYLVHAGPNIGFTFTVQSYANNVVTVAAGTIPTGTTLVGAKVQFVTGSRTLESFQIQRVLSSTQFVLCRVSTALSAGDEFLIQRPSVRMGAYMPTITSPAFTPASLLAVGFVTAGLHFVNPARSVILETAQWSFLQFAAAQFFYGAGAGGALLGGVYRSEDLSTNILGRHCAHFEVGPAFRQQQGPLQAITAIGNTQLSDFDGAPLAGWGIHGNLLLAGSSARLGLVGFTGRLGQASGGLSTFIGGALRVAGADLIVDTVTIGNAASPGAVRLEGNATVQIENTLNGGSNTGHGVVFSGRGNRLYVGTGNTLTASLGDVAMADGTTYTWAQAAEGMRDTLDNEIVSLSGRFAFAKPTPGTLMRGVVLSADPTSPANGDVWITDIAGTRSLCVRIAGTTYRSTLT